MRPATQQEEEFLEAEEAIEASRVLSLAAENELPDYDLWPDEVEEEAEGFDAEAEFRKWNEAQLENRLAMEVEEHFGFEEVVTRRELEELYKTYERNLYLMGIVQDGARLLVDEQRAERASYSELVVLRVASQRLLRVVDASMHSVIQRERTAARREAAAAQRAKQEAEAMTEQCKRLERELEEQRAQHAALASLLELEKERTMCRICYTKERDVLLLPCMHYQFCSGCLAQHRQRHNNCPVCRCPLSGTLQCQLQQ